MTRAQKLLLGAAAIAVLALLGSQWRRERRAEPAAATPGERDGPVASGRRVGVGEPLPQAASISGRIAVADAGESPRARVCVYPAALASSSEAPAWPPELARCVDAEAGRYRVEGLAAGHHVVVANMAGFLPVQHREGPRGWVALRRGEQRVGVDFVMRLRGAPLRGVVRDVAGGTISGAVVRETDGGHTLTDEDGEFTLWVAPQGIVPVTAFAPGYTSEDAFAYPPQAAMTFYLAPESVLRGRVSRADGGGPLADLPVYLRDDRLADAQTGPAGEFELRGLAPGRYKPYVRDDGWCGGAAAPVALGLGETSAELEISARPCRTVAAHVRVRGAQSGCGAAKIELRDAADDVVRRALTDAAGDAALSGVEPGDYRVKIDCPGHVQRAPAPWLLTEAMTSEVTWEVEPGRTLRGAVVDESGAPVPRANIEVVGPYGHVGGYADDDGAFEISGVAPGRNKVLPYHPRHRNGEPLELEVRAQVDPPPVRLEFLDSATLTGRVRARVGDLPPGLTVVARAVDDFGARSTRLDGDGRYTIAGLQPAPYRVAVQRRVGVVEPGSAGELCSGVTVDLGAQARGVADFVLDLAGPGTLTGRVENADGSGEPDALVTVRETLGRGQQRLLTDESGRFTAPVERDATYTVEVTARDGGTASREEVAPDRPLVLRFVATRRVCGTVHADVDITGEFTIETDLGVRESFTGGERWCLEHVPAGARTLSARSPRFGVARARVVVPVAGAVAEVELRFAGRATLRGRVVDSAGEPHADLRVWIVDATGRLVGGTLRTDATGEFVLDGAPAGELTVIPIPVGPYPSRERLLALGTRVTISADAQPEPLTLVVPSVPREAQRGDK